MANAVTTPTALDIFTAVRNGMRTRIVATVRDNGATAAAALIPGILADFATRLQVHGGLDQRAAVRSARGLFVVVSTDLGAALPEGFIAGVIADLAPNT